MKNISYLSKNKTTMLHGVICYPKSGTPKGIVQIVHGMIEHIGRYQQFMEFLADQGYIVAGHDHLGHGSSVETLKDYGYFSKNPSLTLIKDIHQFRKNLQKEYPDLPYYMLGHSMGSFLLRQYLAFFGTGLSGAIIMGTGYTTPALASFGIRLTQMMGRIRGWHYRSRFIQRLTYNRSYKNFDVTGKNPQDSWLSKDLISLAQYAADKRTKFSFTLNGHLGLFEAVAFSCRFRNVDRISKDLPLLITSGEQDPVGGCGKGVRKFFRLCQKARIKHLTLKLYPNDRHEILHETDKENVFSDIAQWLHDHK